jgi:hypothetical protein
MKTVSISGKEDWKKLSMKRGSPARDERDIIARGLEKHKSKVKEPYALATWMAQRGAKSRKRGEVKREFAEQKRDAKKSKLRKKKRSKK